MTLLELGLTFDPKKTALDVHRSIASRHPGITLEDAHVVVQDLASGAKVTHFINALAHKELSDIAVGRKPQVIPTLPARGNPSAPQGRGR